eukprot:1231785-Pyramimonas_sp.AAC.1
MIWLLLDPTLHLEDPTEVGARMERRRIEAAEEREDEEELAHDTALGRFLRGRRLMQKIGWQEGAALGRRGGGEYDAERQLQLCAARSYVVGRSEHAGTGVPKMAGHTCACQHMLDRLLEQCRMTQAA